MSDHEVHPDLQPHVRRMRRLEFLMRQRWFIQFSNRMLKRFLAGKAIDGLDCAELEIPSRAEAHRIRVRIYKPLNVEGPLPALLYCHGGGYLMGIPEIAAPAIERFVATRPCVVIAPDYRKSLLHPYPAGFNDCYDSLLWARDHADELGILSDDFMLAGHSAGGGLTAALALRARDEASLRVAFQLPVYPMLDPTQPEDDARFCDAPVWNSRLNGLAWNAYLADLRDTNTALPAYAAPALSTDFATLPPTISFIGTLDPFLGETRRYTAALAEAGVPVRYREFEGGFHAFESVTTDTAIGAEALDFLYGSFAEFYDCYLRA